ncbi:MerR family transcriptional regulator [Arthrobacter sp. RIT-PI-e]|nr:MerR family transcriptional regulator [Arthrobacter sp. RIT-PI-e]
MNGFEGVGAVARSLGVSVRTLHHWHRCGVAVPSGRTSNGYRMYSEADVARLQRVVLFRDLGVPLQRIPGLLDAGSAQRRAELESRRVELAERILRLQDVDRAVERLLAAEEHGVLVPVPEQPRVFGAQWDPDWPGQARELWGESVQWAQYAERSAARTEADWHAVSVSLQESTDAAAEALRAGVLPGSTEAGAVAEQHRVAMSEYFHCTHSMQVVLARSYVTEPGFRAYYEQAAPGLAVWLQLAIEANARNHGVDPGTARWE